MTPTTLDFLANYRDGVKQMEYQLDIASNADGSLTDARRSTLSTPRRHPDDAVAAA